MRASRWFHRAARLFCLALLAAGCAGAPAQTPPAGVESPPAPESVLQQMEADLDGDGAAEQVSVYQDGQQVRVSISPAQGKGERWSAPLPEGALFDNLTLQDLSADGRPEVLVESHGPGEALFELRIIAWEAGAGRLLKPKGGGLAGSDSFRSDDYRPLVEDLDSNTTYEVVVALRGEDPHFLNTEVYEWDGADFAQSDLFLMPPRLAPTAAAP